MRQFVGFLLGLAVLMLGVLLSLLVVAGISALIWGNHVLHGPQPKGSPQYNFMLFAGPLAISIGGYTVGYALALPIWEKFGVQVGDWRTKSRK